MPYRPPPRRVHPLCIGDENAVMARLTPVSDGTVLAICWRGRLLQAEIIPAPLHLVALIVSDLVDRANRKGAEHDAVHPSA